MKIVHPSDPLAFVAVSLEESISPLLPNWIPLARETSPPVRNAETYKKP